MIGLVYVGGISAALFGWYAWRRFRRSQGKRPRATSFNSEMMLRGTFPEKTMERKPILNILLYLKKLPTDENMIDLCNRLLFYDRYRSSVEKIGGDWKFVDHGIDHIDIKRDHLETIEVASEDELMKVCDELTTQDLPSNKPLWKIYRIVNQNRTQPSAVYFRLHHAIGDGISLVGTMSALFETHDGLSAKIDVPEKMGGGAANSNSVWKFVHSAIEVATLGMSRYDSDIAFSHPNKKKMVFTPRRKTIIFPTLKLSFVKEIKNKAKVSLNDVLFTATAGAIRRYCAMKGDLLFTSSSRSSIVQCRALMPVAFPRKREDTESSTRSLRNYWAFASALLPIRGGTSKERLAECVEITTKVKSSPAAYIQLFIQNSIAPLLPDFVRHHIAQDLFTRHTIVFSNVPGPSEPLYLYGEKLLGLQVLFPNLIAQVVIVSYNGSVFYNMNVDDELVDACDELPRLFLEEMAELAASFGVASDTESMISHPF